jgi:hypothetical protein
LDYEYEQKYFISANHINMCRFSGFEDDGYEKIKDSLSLCLENLQHEDQDKDQLGMSTSFCARD